MNQFYVKSIKELCVVQSLGKCYQNIYGSGGIRFYNFRSSFGNDARQQSNIKKYNLKNLFKLTKEEISPKNISILHFHSSATKNYAVSLRYTLKVLQKLRN